VSFVVGNYKKWPCTFRRTWPPGRLRSSGSRQAPLRHPGGTPYRCFLPDLAGFGGSCRAGPTVQHLLTGGVTGDVSPREGIQPRYGGLRVQGTASSPSSTAVFMLPQDGRLSSGLLAAEVSLLGPAADGRRRPQSVGVSGPGKTSKPCSAKWRSKVKTVWMPAWRMSSKLV
jgi:hypothetical protein